MAALTQSNTQPGTSPNVIRGFKEGNLKVRFFDVTLDGGDYAQTGLAITAASLGFKRISFVTLPPVVQKSTSALANVLGITYASDSTSFNLFLFECGADGDQLDNKPAEAVDAGLKFRIRVEGF